MEKPALFEADRALAQHALKMVNEIKTLAGGNAQLAIAIVSAVAANAHLATGGQLDKIERVGDLFKAAIEASLYAAKDHKQAKERKGLII